MAAASELLSFSDSPVFRQYATYAAAVILKMMILAPWTSRFRLAKNVRACEAYFGSIVPNLVFCRRVALLTTIIPGIRAIVSEPKCATIQHNWGIAIYGCANK